MDALYNHVELLQCCHLLFYCQLILSKFRARPYQTKQFRVLQVKPETALADHTLFSKRPGPFTAFILKGWDVVRLMKQWPRPTNTGYRSCYQSFTTADGWGLKLFPGQVHVGFCHSAKSNGKIRTGNSKSTPQDMSSSCVLCYYVTRLIRTLNAKAFDHKNVFQVNGISGSVSGFKSRNQQ